MKKLIVFVLLAILLVPSHSAFAKMLLELWNHCSGQAGVKIEVRSTQGLIVTTPALDFIHSNKVEYMLDQPFTPKAIYIIYPDGSYSQHQDELAGINPDPDYVFISIFHKWPLREKEACYPDTVKWYPR